MVEEGLGELLQRILDRDKPVIHGCHDCKFGEEARCWRSIGNGKFMFFEGWMCKRDRLFTDVSRTCCLKWLAK